jgi:hypothetical protein
VSVVDLIMGQGPSPREWRTKKVLVEPEGEANGTIVE